MEILLFGHCANMFAQLPKNHVLVSWLLSPLLWNWYNICSFSKQIAVWVHEEQPCVGT